eukprot:6069586-Amphidinium_carterae.1
MEAILVSRRAATGTPSCNGHVSGVATTLAGRGENTSESVTTCSLNLAEAARTPPCNARVKCRYHTRGARRKQFIMR